MLAALGAVRIAAVSHALSESLAFATVIVTIADVLTHILTAHVGEVPLVEAAFLAAHDPSSIRTIFVVVTEVGLFEQGTELDLNLRFASRAFTRPSNRIKFGVKGNLHEGQRRHRPSALTLRFPFAMPAIAHMDAQSGFSNPQDLINSLTAGSVLGTEVKVFCFFKCLAPSADDWPFPFLTVTASSTSVFCREGQEENAECNNSQTFEGSGEALAFISLEEDGASSMLTVSTLDI